MAGLSRKGAGPLLRMVRGKPHATDDDHVPPPFRRPHVSATTTTKTTSPAAADIYRDPESDPESPSSDKSSEVDLTPPRPRQGAPTVRPGGGPRITKKVVDVNIHSKAGITKSKSKGTTAGKLASNDVEDDVIFGSSQGSQKRVKSSYGKTTKRAKPNPMIATANNGPVKLARPSGGDMLKPQGVPETRMKLVRPGVSSTDEQKMPISSQSSGIVFRKFPGSAPASTKTSAVSKTVDCPSSPLSVSRSLSLSSMSSPEPEVVATLQMPKVKKYVTTAPCPICGEHVEESFKHDFFVERCGGKRMNFRLQELFCRSHKERAAKKTWQDRDYPELDWSKLHERLEKHNRRIQDVLDGNVRSVYRDELEERLRSGKTKTAMQSWNNEQHTSVNVGYYGTRGERAMTDHIVKRFGSDLRRRAGSDNAIAAMGVSGGVSGYLQSVLVPEMALALVMEDADCDADEAKRIIEESSDIGEALNEAEEEKVPQSTARLLRDESEENLHEGRHTILLD